MNIPIGKRIRKARRDSDLTQKQVAEMVGFSAQALSAIENGSTVEPDRSNLISLARVLKNDFGEGWLTEYVNEKSASADKQAIIAEISIEEIAPIKFPGANPRRTKEEMIRMRDYINSKLAEIPDED